MKLSSAPPILKHGAPPPNLKQFEKRLQRHLATILSWRVGAPNYILVSPYVPKIRDNHHGRGQTGQTILTFKLDFPGNLWRAAFAILAMFPIGLVSSYSMHFWRSIISYRGFFAILNSRYALLFTWKSFGLEFIKTTFLRQKLYLREKIDKFWAK